MKCGRPTSTSIARLLPRRIYRMSKVVCTSAAVPSPSSLPTAAIESTAELLRLIDEARREEEEAKRRREYLLSQMAATVRCRHYAWSLGKPGFYYFVGAMVPQALHLALQPVTHLAAAHHIQKLLPFYTCTFTMSRGELARRA